MVLHADPARGLQAKEERHVSDVANGLLGRGGGAATRRRLLPVEELHAIGVLKAGEARHPLLSSAVAADFLGRSHAGVIPHRAYPCPRLVKHAARSSSNRHSLSLWGFFLLTKNRL